MENEPEKKAVMVMTAKICCEYELVNELEKRARTATIGRAYKCTDILNAHYTSQHARRITATCDALAGPEDADAEMGVGVHLKQLQKLTRNPHGATRKTHNWDL